MVHVVAILLTGVLDGCTVEYMYMFYLPGWLVFLQFSDAELNEALQCVDASFLSVRGNLKF